MTPIPRSKGPSSDSDGEKKLRMRLDALIGLMILQIFLSVGMWMDKDDSPKDPEQETVINETASQETEINEAEESVEVVLQPVDSTKLEIDWTMIKIDVLNGCGVTGIAGKSQKWLKRNGFRIRLAENADRHDYSKSIIQDRSGNIKAAKELAEALGIESSQIIPLTGTPSPYVDLTLVIGKDYKRLPLDQ